MSSWTDLDTDDFGADKGGAFTLFQDFSGNDDALVAQPFQVDFTEKSGNATHPTFSSDRYSMQVYVPKAAKFLRIDLEIRVASGTGYVRGILGAENSDADLTTTSTSYVVVTLVWSDISDKRDTIVALAFQVSNSGGANTFIQSVDRCTARWGID